MKKLLPQDKLGKKTTEKIKLDLLNTPVDTVTPLGVYVYDVI